MNLRLRLIVAFFVLSVVPLGAVTFYTYVSNASAVRDAAGREAHLLAGELTERMALVTTQLSQRFVQLMDIPAPAQEQAVSAAVPAKTATKGTTKTKNRTSTKSVATTAASQTAAKVDAEAKKADQAAQVAQQLGEVAILLNNIDIHGFGRGGGFGAGRAFPPPDAVFSGRPPPRPGPGGREGDVVPPALEAAPAPVPTTKPAEPTQPSSPAPDARPERRRDVEAGRRGGGPAPGGPPPPPEPSDPGRLQIDLRPMRREILQQIFPDRDRWDQLSREEREVILAKVNERMLGIQQGIQILQQKATEQAADAKVAADAAGTRRRPSVRSTKPAAAASLPSTPPAAPATPAPPPLQRKTALAGSRMDVRLLQNGQVLGQVNADINLPNLLATVFTATRRDKGDVPFAVDKNGALYTPTDADRARITALGTSAVRPDTPPGTVVLPTWVVVTAADPTGSGLKFGIARPLGPALDDLRRSSARNAALGLGFIGLALIGIVPLSSRLTRNLSRLSDGVNRLAQGDYHARVDVPSTDEIGGLAAAFNHMAAEVEEHQREAVGQERIKRELELGRQIQHDMLPHEPLRFGQTEVRGVSVPATEVGGDFFNYFPTTAGNVALIVGDVSGKGVGAALLMANIQASLRARLALGQDLASLARELDDDTGASTPGPIYATLFVGLLDPKSRVLQYVNAGHNPQFVLRAGGGLERMESTGLPIGLFAGHDYGERRVTLAPGDVLFFYTDGCVEAENQAGEMFGRERLEALLSRRPSGSGEDLLARIEREINQFRSGREPFDDATMMVANVG